MPKPLSEQSKRGIVGEYLKGNSYREISSSTNVSLGATSNTIGEAKKMYPDLEHLRELRSKLPTDVDIPALNKAIATVLEAQRQLGIDVGKMPEYVEARKKEINDLGKQTDSLKNEVSELSSQRDNLQSDVKELSDKKTQLGKNLVEFEEASKHLAAYGIDMKDIDRLRTLLDGINNHALDVEKCISAIQEHELLFKEIDSMRGELDELTMWKNVLSYSLTSLERQHTEKGLQLRLKSKTLERREREIQEVDRHISQLKGEIEKLEARKQAIINETSLEREKRQRMLEAYRAERDDLKREVEALKAQILELEKLIAEKGNIITVRR